MMYRRSKMAWVIAVYLAVLSTQGCSSMKWFDHGSDETSSSSTSRYPGDLGKGLSPSRDSDRSSQPSIARDGSPSLDPRHDSSDPEGGRLRGLAPVHGERIALEEQLSRSRLSTLLQSNEEDERTYAEFKRDEAAAVAAGLQDVFFQYNRWSVEEAGMQALMHNAGWLRAHPNARLRISGHCDERGSHDYNLVLGEKRALAAQNVLIQLGVKPQQVSIVSYGKDRPFCREHDDACYQENRRDHMLLNQQ